MKKRVFALVLTLVMLMGLAVPTFAEEPAEETTVTAQTMTEWKKAGCPDVTELQIATVSDFKIFMDEIQASEPALKSVSQINAGSTFAFEGVTIYLTNDLDLNPGWECTMDASWADLKNDDDFEHDSLNNAANSVPALPDYTIQVHKGETADQKGFGGMLDGMGHTIIGLCIVSSGTGSAQSMLGTVHSETDFVVGVKNLSLKNSYIEGTNAGLASLIGGVTAGTNAVIENCYVDVDLYSTSTAAAKTNITTGGLVAQVSGNLTIKDTVYAGDIFNAMRGDLRQVGGAIGLVMGAEAAADEPANVTIENFAFTGNINWDKSQRGSSLIGRVQNHANVEIKNVLALGGVLSDTGGLCRNIAAVKTGTTTTFKIENCLYFPNVSQTAVYDTSTGGNIFVGYDMTAHSRVEKYLHLVVSASARPSYESLKPGVSTEAQGAALGTVVAEVKNIVIVDNKDYVGLTAAEKLTANGIAGFEAVEEGYPLPSALVAIFGANVAGKSEITNPPENTEEQPTEPSEPSESTEPTETTKPSNKPTKAPANTESNSETGNENPNDNTSVIIGVAVCVVVVAAIVVVVISLKKKAKQ